MQLRIQGGQPSGRSSTPPLTISLQAIHHRWAPSALPFSKFLLPPPPTCACVGGGALGDAPPPPTPLLRSKFLPSPQLHCYSPPPYTNPGCTPASPDLPVSHADNLHKSHFSAVGHGYLETFQASLNGR